MTARIRSFLAVHVAAAAVEEIRVLSRSLRREVEAAGLQVAWTRPENLHVTVKFLGDIDEAEIDGLAGALRSAAPAAARLRVLGLAAFPDLLRPRVLHAAVVDEGGGLVALQRLVEEVAARRGHAREGRPFRPHLTLGRVRRGRGDLSPVFAPHLERPLGPATDVEELVLYESRPGSAGMDYIARARIPLVRPGC